MCQYEAIQYTGRVSCGHVFTHRLERCKRALQRPNGEACGKPTGPALDPKAGKSTETWRMIKDAGILCLDGPCPLCKSCGYVDITRFLPFPFEPNLLKRFFTGSSKRQELLYQPQWWSSAPDSRGHRHTGVVRNHGVISKGSTSVGESGQK